MIVLVLTAAVCYLLYLRSSDRKQIRPLQEANRVLGIHYRYSGHAQGREQ